MNIDPKLEAEVMAYFYANDDNRTGAIAKHFKINKYIVSHIIDRGLSKLKNYMGPDINNLYHE